MSTLTIGKNDVAVTGVFQLQFHSSNKPGFRITNLISHVPKGKTLKDKVLFMGPSGLLDTLIIDKLVSNYRPDASDIDRHNVEVLLQHPEVKIGGYTKEEHAELVALGIKKQSCRFTITNVDKAKDVKYEETGRLLRARARLYDESSSALTTDMLVFLASKMGVPHKTAITSRENYRKFLVRQLDGKIQSDKDSINDLMEAIDNIKTTEHVFYINEMQNRGIIENYAGIFKIGAQPIGVDIRSVMAFFEQNADVFQQHKNTIITILKQESILE